MNGILLVDKPQGITSYDVIRRLQRVMGELKMGHALHLKKIKIGHAGTLDPRASGLMLIGVGEGTKELSKLLKLPKTYEAEILLGILTDTGDMDGKVLKEFSIFKDQFSLEEIRDAVTSLEGTHALPVPAYSAIKRGGEPLYKKARRGEVMELPIKEMKVNEVEVKNISYEEKGRVIVNAIFAVESGTYIRSLAEEIGRRLGVPATLKELRRTRIGDFKIEDAHQLAEYETKSQKDDKN